MFLQQSDFVFFGNLTHPSGSVTHLGDNLTGVGDGDDEQIKIDLSISSWRILLKSLSQ